jgi:hypothetical protein
MKEIKGPFDYVNSINDGVNIVRGTDNEGGRMKKYVPFLVNRAFSQHNDAIYHANLINLNSHIDNIMQYEYYLHALRKKKRFGSWPKKDQDQEANLKTIAKYYNVSRSVASSYARLLTKEQIHELELINYESDRHNE